MAFTGAVPSSAQVGSPNCLSEAGGGNSVLLAFSQGRWHVFTWTLLNLWCLCSRCSSVANQPCFKWSAHPDMSRPVLYSTAAAFYRGTLLDSGLLDSQLPRLAVSSGRGHMQSDGIFYSSSSSPVDSHRRIRRLHP